MYKNLLEQCAKIIVNHGAIFFVLSCAINLRNRKMMQNILRRVYVKIYIDLYIYTYILYLYDVGCESRRRLISV